MKSRIVGLAFAGMVCAASASAATFTVRPGGDTKVVFTSKAPVETFEGRTDRMQGTITVDPAAVGDSITVHLEVDLASLDTGKKLRNRHMRENHLETDKYPKAVFDGATVRPLAGGKLEPGKPSAFEVDGTFTLHGVSRRLRSNAEVTLDPTGTKLAFQATFAVSLPDYAIKRPEFLFMKLAEAQQLRVSATAASTP
jgi:polyisoprenoid-binding protein YceI